MKKNRKFIRGFFIILALMLFLYPVYEDYQAMKETNKEINEFEKNFKIDTKQDKSNIDIEVYKNKPIGVLYIPSLNSKLLVYGNANEYVLSHGVGLLENTSPIGSGVNTRSVLSSHSGLSISQLFTNLPKMKKGDKFYIKTKDEIFAYETTELETVEPDDYESILPEEGKELCTLLTCVPIFINSHRLLVTGERISENAIPKVNTNFLKDHIVYLSIVFGIFFIFIIGSLLLKKRRKNKEVLEINDYEKK